MSTPLICRVVFALIIMSVVYELATGTARVRGIGNFSRRGSPWQYWSAISFKTILAIIIAVLGST